MRDAHENKGQIDYEVVFLLIGLVPPLPLLLPEKLLVSLQEPLVGKLVLQKLCHRSQLYRYTLSRILDRLLMKRDVPFESGYLLQYLALSFFVGKATGLRLALGSAVPLRL